MTTATPTRQRKLPLPPLIYVCAIAISIILHTIYPLPWITQPLSDILFAAGWLVLAAFAALFITAIMQMRRMKTTIDPNGIPEHLVTAGPFAVSRNPIYLADTLLLIGVGLVSGIAWFLPLAVIAAFVTQKVAIEPEEKLLGVRFGKKYRDYAKRVRRWI